MKIGFIGYGNLAKAIARGLLKQEQYELFASSPSLAAGTTREGIQTHFDNQITARHADILILAVKPKMMSAVLEEINPVLPKETLLVSVAAGLTLEWFEAHTNPGQAVIRTIPNTPASIGLSATPLIANVHVSSQQKQSVEDIFNRIGITTWAHHEDELNVFTALSASGPAYVFLFIETLVDAAVKLGLEEAIAKTFAIQMVKGATELAFQSDLTLKQLRERVATPGGTTAAALNVLHNKLDELMLLALKAAANRSIELGMKENR